MLSKYPRAANAFIVGGIMSAVAAVVSFIVPKLASVDFLRAFAIAAPLSTYLVSLCFRNGMTKIELWVRRIIACYVDIGVYAVFFITFGVVRPERISFYLIFCAVAAPVATILAYVAVDLYQRRTLKRINEKLSENDK